MTHIPPSEGRVPDDALLKRYEHRAALMLSEGRPVGWLTTGVLTLIEVKARWWRKVQPRVDGLCWQVTWTDRSRFENGYAEVWGDELAPEDVAETLRDWDAGWHEMGGERFELRWLAGDEARDAWANYGWGG